MLERSSRMLSFEVPHSRDVDSLKIWDSMNASISREETEFLNRREDLLSLSAANDSLISWLERFLADRIMALRKASHHFRELLLFCEQLAGLGWFMI